MAYALPRAHLTRLTFGGFNAKALHGTAVNRMRLCVTTQTAPAAAQRQCGRNLILARWSSAGLDFPEREKMMVELVRTKPDAIRVRERG